MKSRDDQAKGACTKGLGFGTLYNKMTPSQQTTQKFTHGLIKGLARLAAWLATNRSEALGGLCPRWGFANCVESDQSLFTCAPRAKQHTIPGFCG